MGFVGSAIGDVKILEVNQDGKFVRLVNDGKQVRKISFQYKKVVIDRLNDVPSTCSTLFQLEHGKMRVQFTHVHQGFAILGNGS